MSEKMKVVIETPKREDPVVLDNVEAMIGILSYVDEDDNKTYTNSILVGEMTSPDAISLIRELILSENISKLILEFNEELEKNDFSKQLPVFAGFDLLAKFVELQQNWEYTREAMTEGKAIGMSSEVM